MKQNKDKQIRELKGRVWMVLIIGFFIGAYSVMGLHLFIGKTPTDFDNLEQELQSCQDKVEVENETYDTLQICNPQDGCRNAIKCDWIDSLNLYRDCEVIG